VIASSTNFWANAAFSRDSWASFWASSAFYWFSSASLPACSAFSVASICALTAEADPYFARVAYWASSSISYSIIAFSSNVFCRSSFAALSASKRLATSALAVSISASVSASFYFLSALKSSSSALTFACSA
jgi:hypothetical protein